MDKWHARRPSLAGIRPSLARISAYIGNKDWPVLQIGRAPATA